MTPSTSNAFDIFPVAHVDLQEEVALLRASPMSHGHVSKTLVRDRDVRLVLMVLQRGAQIARHQAKASLAVQVLDGRVVISLLSSSLDLCGGQVLAIEANIPHALIAIEDSALLLTIGRASSTTRSR